MKLVYIAGPFAPTARQRANIHECFRFGHGVMAEDSFVAANIARATRLALRVAESGHMPVCPHSNTSDEEFLSLQTPEFWYAGTLELMRRCDAIALTDDWRESNGACREVIEAERIGKALWEDGDCIADIPQYAAMEAYSALRSRGQEP